MSAANGRLRLLFSDDKVSHHFELDRQVIYSALIVCAILGQSDSPVLEAAQARFARMLAIEGAGVFWILAEVAILYFVTVGGRMLRRRPLPQRLTLVREDRVLAAILASLSATLFLLLCVRHAIQSPLPTALEQASYADPTRIGEAAYVAFAEYARVHIMIWCSFIVLWVLLEVAIVVQGIRAFRALSGLLYGPSPEIRPTHCIAMLAACGMAAASGASAQFDHAVEVTLQTGYMKGVEDARAGFRFVEFLVRTAGMIWIVAEWIAVVYLLRGFFMLRRWFREHPRVA